MSLRTPLNIILGYIDLIREGEIGQIDHQASQSLERVRQSANHMIVLVNDLLDLARIEEGDLPVRREPVNLPALLHEICGQWEQVCRDKHISFSRHWPDTLPLLMTDRARFRQIMHNLLDNALKFTSAGEITVWCSCSRRTHLHLGPRYWYWDRN